MTLMQVPLLILGGSDHEPIHLPPTGRGKHPLTGCKAVDVRIRDRPLISLLLERLERVGTFSPIYIAGPRAAYEGIGEPVEMIDTDSGFGRNIQVGLESVISRHPESPVAIITADVLPEPAELTRLLDHYFANAPADLWFPIIRAPQDPKALGASAWKPQYFVVPRGEHRAVRVLPGHLTICDPEALRLQFLYRLMDLAYRSRNRPILYRRAYMLRQLIVTILTQDVRHIVQLRLPTFTWDVVRYGTVGARRLKDGIVSQDELEDALRHIFAKRRHRKRFPERRIHTPVMEALSLARDIDTQEEAEAVGASIASEPK